MRSSEFVHHLLGGDPANFNLARAPHFAGGNLGKSRRRTFGYGGHIAWSCGNAVVKSFQCDCGLPEQYELASYKGDTPGLACSSYAPLPFCQRFAGNRVTK